MILFLSNDACGTFQPPSKLLGYYLVGSKVACEQSDDRHRNRIAFELDFEVRTHILSLVFP
jgi:hypothetical protein